MCHKTFAIFMKFHEAKDCGILFVLFLTENDSMLTMSQQHFGPTSISSATGHHLLLLSVLLAFFH